MYSRRDQPLAGDPPVPHSTSSKHSKVPSLLLPLQQANTHAVPARQWKKWCDLAQRVFNETYAVMLVNQDILIHPQAKKTPDDWWSTTAWNSAWLAADAAQKAIVDISRGVGYATKPH